MILYTDASWEPSGCRLGAFLKDGELELAGFLDFEPQWVPFLRPRETNIGPAETVTPLAAATTWPEHLAGREVL